MPTPAPKLLDQVRQTLRTQHYAYRTEQAYLYWIKRFILFHHKQHPKNLNSSEIEAFLTDLAVKRHVAPSTQNQALATRPGGLTFLIPAGPPPGPGSSYRCRAGQNAPAPPTNRDVQV